MIGLLLKALRWLSVGLAGLLLFGVLLVLPLRWLNPPTTAFMIGNALGGSDCERISQRWVAWPGISPWMALAAVAAEDQRFPEHFGFDLRQIRAALQASARGAGLRGASTISQQVSKNLFLWSGRSWFRKGLEAYLTLLGELFWSKRRMLEIYLNVAQFGPCTYGVGSAAEAVFGVSAQHLDPSQSARLAAVLPNPVRYRAEAPDGHILERQRWIRRQMRNLGGLSYLQGWWQDSDG